MHERPYRIELPDVTLTEATEEDRTWFVARMRCPECSLLVVREHRAPVGAQAILLQAMEEHLGIAHGI